MIEFDKQIKETANRTQQVKNRAAGGRSGCGTGSEES